MAVKIICKIYDGRYILHHRKYIHVDNGSVIVQGECVPTLEKGDKTA